MFKYSLVSGELDDNKWFFIIIKSAGSRIYMAEILLN